VRRLSKFLLVFVRGLSYAIFFIRPLTQIDHLAALAAEWPEAVICVPLMFFAALRAADYPRRIVPGVGVLFH
jgi:hypothetical protein